MHHKTTKKPVAPIVPIPLKGIQKHLLLPQTTGSTNAKIEQTDNLIINVQGPPHVSYKECTTTEMKQRTNVVG